MRMKAATHLVAFTTLALVFAENGCRERPSPKPVSAPAAATQTVQLTIDYGDGGQKRLTALAWRDGTTVLDLLEAAKAHPHGITFTKRGSGQATLVTKIDDLAKQEGSD